MQLKNYLLTHPGFKFMEVQDVEHVAAAMRVEDYPDEHVFIYQDRLSKELYLLLDGRIKVNHYSKTGRYYSIKTIQPGEFFGIPSISKGKPATSSYAAEGPVKVASMPYSAYLLLYQPASELGCRFQFVIAHQLARDLHDRHDALRNLLGQIYGVETTSPSS